MVCTSKTCGSWLFGKTQSAMSMVSESFQITNWGPCIWGKQASQPCNQYAKMMLCLAIVIGTLLEDCLIHHQRQSLLGVGCPCFGTSQVLLRPTFPTSRNSVTVVPFRLFYCVFNALQIWPTLNSNAFVLALGLKVCVGCSELPPQKQHSCIQKSRSAFRTRNADVSCFRMD